MNNICCVEKLKETLILKFTEQAKREKSMTYFPKKEQKMVRVKN